MNDRIPPIDVEAVLHSLKDFQRDTVEYVFRRLYQDNDAQHRFLIADEVGLGKTLVARGLIAKAVNHLRNKVERIDIVYICSNGDIARQNIDSLNVTSREIPVVSRITLLPTELRDAQNNSVNFISFTPRTSFHLISQLGIANERALLYWMLREVWGLRGTGALNLLQGRVLDYTSFRARVNEFQYKEIDQSLVSEFESKLQDSVQMDIRSNRVDLKTRFDNLCKLFRNPRGNVPLSDRQARDEMIGELRMLLASTCLKSLKPDLIILDEFQRFKDLLDGQDEAGQLAKKLFNYSDETSTTRVVLLSATPYKMYTLEQEGSDDNHYEDFIRTFRFLQTDTQQADQFEQQLTEYRREILRIGDGDRQRLVEIKHSLEVQLRKVMVRTERLAVKENRDDMLVEVKSSDVQLKTQDLESYIALEHITKMLGQYSSLEYWKSAPYLLNFMDDYELKKEFRKAVDDHRDLVGLSGALGSSAGLLLPWSDFEAYREIDPGNARLRDLLQQTIGSGTWQLLWIPPALPYYQLGGPFAHSTSARFTKRLVFSSWKFVPKVISTLLSYEAERRMIISFNREAENTLDERKGRRPLLRFGQSEGRLTGMPVLGLIYPCLTLVRRCDPLILSKNDQYELGKFPASDVIARASLIIEQMLPKIQVNQTASGQEDESWYWAAPILLDLIYYPQDTEEWFKQPNHAAVWSGNRNAASGEEEFDSQWAAHVKLARALMRDYNNGELSLGRKPADLSRVLAQMAIAGCGVSSLRALTRVTNESGIKARNGAGQMAWSFLSLFNMPEVMALIRSLNREEPYWRRVLDYALDGCLQSTLDEYAHVLRERLSKFDKEPEKIVAKISDAISEALTLRTASLGVDEIRMSVKSKTVEFDPRKIRSRFAARFDNEKTDDGQEANRADQVRAAFNSPFWPFVLATTSVGQEGLDFHLYCHAVVHWNLPTNPVDLEQREGRVHRYKGHAIRKNVAKTYGSSVQGSGDPWKMLFEAAIPTNDQLGERGIIPFWVFSIPDGAKIERHVPALPLSRDLERLVVLRKSLAVYRMVFGQNRQEDLVAYLVSCLAESDVQKIVADLRIDLSPPRSGKTQL